GIRKLPDKLRISCCARIQMYRNSLIPMMPAEGGTDKREGWALVRALKRLRPLTAFVPLKGRQCVEMILIGHRRAPVRTIYLFQAIPERLLGSKCSIFTSE